MTGDTLCAVMTTAVMLDIQMQTMEEGSERSNGKHRGQFGWSSV